MYNSSRMRAVPALLFSLALFLGACISPSNPIGTVSPSAPTAIPPTEPVSTEPAGGFLIYYLFPGKSEASYSVNVHPAGQEDVSETLTGSTDQVTGAIRLRRNDPAQAELDPIEVDLQQLASDDPQRDQFIREQYLRTDLFPTMIFVATEIDGLPVAYKDGQVVSLEIRGDLTIRDVTRSVIVNAQVQRSRGKISGNASTTIRMSDFGLGPIVLPGGFTAEDEIQLKLEFSAMPLVE